MPNSLYLRWGIVREARLSPAWNTCAHETNRHLISLFKPLFDETVRRRHDLSGVTLEGRAARRRQERNRLSIEPVVPLLNLCVLTDARATIACPLLPCQLVLPPITLFGSNSSEEDLLERWVT
jgi:hypothetical protein